MGTRIANTVMNLLEQCPPLTVAKPGIGVSRGNESRLAEIKPRSRPAKKVGFLAYEESPTLTLCLQSVWIWMMAKEIHHGKRYTGYSKYNTI